MKTIYKFEWDEQKNVSNQKGHGVSFQHACKAFDDPMHIVLDDDAHSKNKPRYFLIGFDGIGILTVRFTLRSGSIRIFGAGYWRKGRALYEGRK